MEFVRSSHYICDGYFLGSFKRAEELSVNISSHDEWSSHAVIACATVFV